MRQNQNSAFLPEGYISPKGESNYMHFEKGENKFRILSRPIIGWEDWTTDKKPVRFLFNQKPEKPIRPDKAIKFFWAMIVWNYKSNSIQILELTQKTIQSVIESLAKDEEWGSPYQYDIKVIRDGDRKEDTVYTVNPSPKKPVSEEILEAFKAKPCFLGALYQGADPFINHGEITPLNDLAL